MKSLETDSSGDLILDGQKSFRMVEGVDEAAQAIRILLGTNTGEWFLNKAHGLDYSAIQVKAPEMQEVRMAIQEALDQEARIENIEKIELNFDEKERKLKVDLRLQVEGGIVDEQVEVG